MYRFLLCVALSGASAVPCFALAQGAPVTPNLGAVHGEGSLTDGDGDTGSWTIDATLADGDFTGTGSVTLRGATMRGALPFEPFEPPGLEVRRLVERVDVDAADVVRLVGDVRGEAVD